MKGFFVCICSLFLGFVNAVELDFYLWQRIHTQVVTEAVNRFYSNYSGDLYFLAGEFENNGKVVTLNLASKLNLSRSIPVFRIHIKHMNKSAQALADEIVKLYEPYRQAQSLQIDLDAPESKLLYYRDLMLELRKKLPGVKLSATVLPCHLKHRKNFFALASACDFYVLQVHGLTKESGEWSIYNHRQAVAAVKKAKSIKKPFKVALPLYANLLSNHQLVQPNLYEVSELSKLCDEIIVFRLGIDSDGLSLDANAATAICNGNYAPRVHFHWVQKDENLWYLEVENSGFFSSMKSTLISYQESPLDIDTFNYSILNKDELQFLLPPSGTKKLILWVRLKKGQSASQIINLTIKD